MALSERIRQIVERMKWQDQEFAEKLGMSKQTLSQRFSKSNWTMEEIVQITEISGFSIYWICQGLGPEKEIDVISAIEMQALPMASDVKEPINNYLTGKSIRPITVTVDKAGREMISYVPVKAQAGYTRGYGDAHYIESLPAFNLPVVNGNGTMRMFQVSGDSMLQLGGGGLHDGDVVVAQYVEDFTSLKDNRVYVVVAQDGIVVKRVINRLTTADRVLILKSDNKNGNYPDRLLHPEDIIEVWELKAFLSRQLSFSTDLWEIINDLQAKQAILAERVDSIEGPRTLKPRK